MDATINEVNSALQESQIAFLSYKNFSGKKKAGFLRSIADEIEALGQPLVSTAMQETNLAEARIVNERGRTTSHCRMFANLVEDGSWVDARIDTAIPDRAPAPKADLRKMLVPIGTVVVFGAANFPLAYSTAGGDTISALAAGCPVIVKAHPAHAATSDLVASAIFKAIEKTGMPKGVFQHVHGGFETGQALVKHPFTKAVGFTGSLAGGKALFDLANQRAQPIPVFAEMSSINPVILLPDTLQKDAEKTAEKLAASITLGVGQFCTNPGLIIAVEGNGLDRFIKTLSLEFQKAMPGTMLHQGIADNYSKRLAQALTQKGVQVEGQSLTDGNAAQGRPLVASVAANDFIKNPALAEEVFGPYSLIVRCKSNDELNSVINHSQGARVMQRVPRLQTGGKLDASLFNVLVEKAGRLVINGVPTGVEVCPSMQHGGPYPATTDSRFTAVGTDAIKRFVRPVSFQNFPDSLLPNELKDKNPLGIWRMLDGKWVGK